MKKICYFFYFTLCYLSAPLYSLPKNHTIKAGEAKIDSRENILEITVSDRAVLNWESFSIASGETTHFIQPSSQSAVLNRVTGKELSELSGLLKANGRVYLVNPNGMVVGKEGRIDTLGFMGTTLEMKNEPFLSGEIFILDGDSLAEIVNWGAIETNGGDLTLIAHQLTNKGEISSSGGPLHTLSAHKVLLDSTGDALLYVYKDLQDTGMENSSISSVIGRGESIDASAIVRSGGKITLCAKEGRCQSTGTLISPGGEVQLLGSNIHLDSQALIDVSSETGGGSIWIGGGANGMDPKIPNAETVWIGREVEVCADASVNGDGGNVIVWGNDSNCFLGKISAQGGVEGGNGGFVEISSPGNLIMDGLVNTLAPKGKRGTLLLDPTNVCIEAMGDGYATFNNMTLEYNFTGHSTLPCTVSIASSNIEMNLAMGDVTINTSAPTDQFLGLGDISVNADLIWSSDSNLTFNAQNNINFNGVTLSCSGQGTINFFVDNKLNINDGTILDFNVFPNLPVNQMNLSGNLDFVSSVAFFVDNAVLTAPTVITANSPTSVFFQLTGSDLTIHASDLLIGSNITVNSAQFSSGGQSVFAGNITSTSGPITMTSQSDMFIESNTSITVMPSIGSSISMNAENGNIIIDANTAIQTDGNITMISAGSLFINGNCSISTTSPGTTITLVVDNIFPNPPDYGFFSFLMPSDLILCTNNCNPGGGQIQLYTSVAGINMFPNMINGVSYMPGTFNASGTYSFAPYEYLGYWYQMQPPPVNDAPFNVIFKSLSLPSFAPPDLFIRIALTEPVAAQTTPQENVQNKGVNPNPKNACKVPSISIQAL